jgi:phenylacetic acid degradation operon negative regulatory protein
MNSKSSNQPDVLAPLLAFGDLKVWSVLATILGDLAAQKGTSIPGPSLSTLTTRMGIRPEALRVALYRLRKDGWIVSHKVGRISHYALSDHGRHETVAAQNRIYAPELPRISHWFLALLPTNAPAPPDQPHIPLGRNAYLMPKPPLGLADTLIAELTTTALPDWVREAALPPATLGAYLAWKDTLGQLPSNLAALDPGDQLALRILALHHWRRIVLRHNALADATLAKDWVGAACRSRMAAILDAIPRPQL